MKNAFFVSIDTTDKAGGIFAFLEIEPTTEPTKHQHHKQTGGMTHHYKA